MTQTRFEEVFLGYAANTIPNRVIAKVLHSVMEEIDAPEWTKEEFKFAEEMQSHFEPEIIRRAAEQLEEIGAKLGQTKICDTILPYSDRIVVGSGSTDVGDVSWVVPTSQCTTTCSVLGIPGHSWAEASCSGMSIGHKGMLYAAKILGVAGYRFLTDASLRDKARAEWEHQLKGRKYESLIPSEVDVPPLPFE
ncbi:MAG TPA: amidohydrolase [Firmicutes bacterium]|nr:amidohydrolase [Candidatus Fermentithermobacillaceae bacterium]